MRERDGMTASTHAAASAASAADVDNVRTLATDRRINSRAVEDRDAEGHSDPPEIRAKTSNACIPPSRQRAPAGAGRAASVTRRSVTAAITAASMHTPVTTATTPGQPSPSNTNPRPQPSALEPA